MRILPLLFLCTCLPLCFAQDRLEPGDSSSASDDYYKNTKSVLAPGFTQDVLFRVQVYPSFRPEWVVGLRKTNDAYQLFYVVAKQTVWGVEILKDYESGKRKGMDGMPLRAPDNLKKEYPWGYMGIAIENHDLTIDEKTAEQMLAAFKTIISDAQKPPRPQRGFDGVTYVFEAKAADGWIAAHIWSPKEGSYAKKCVDFADLIRTVALSEKDAALLMPTLRRSENPPNKHSFPIFPTNTRFPGYPTVFPKSSLTSNTGTTKTAL